MRDLSPELVTGRGRGMRYDSIVVVVLSSQFCMKRPDLLSGLSFFTSRFNLLIANHLGGKSLPNR